MNFAHILVLVIVAIGFIEWLKILLDRIGNVIVPIWLWAVLLLPVAFATSVIADVGPVWVTEALFALAVAQLAYDNIVKLVQRAIEKV